MKKTFVRDFENKQKIEDFFLVRQAEEKISLNKKKYLEAVLADSSGDIAARKWELEERDAYMWEPSDHPKVIWVQAATNEWNGRLQLVINDWRTAKKADNLKIEDFIKAAPEKPEDMYEYILSKAEEIGDEELRNICMHYLENEKNRLKYFPAAVRNHHAEYAGLLYHTKRMLTAGDALCEVYSILDRDWVRAGVILHDMQKLNEMDADRFGIATGYTFEGSMLGHLVMGVREIEKEAEKLGISREKAVMLEHMVLAHHYEPEFGSPVRPMFPEAEILHYLDVMDARMFDIEEAVVNTKPGKFSQKLRTLNNRRIYRRTDDVKEEEK